MKITKALTIGLVVGLIVTATAASQTSTPQLIRLQGFLSEDIGGAKEPVNAGVSMTFDLYNAPVGGVLIHSVGPLSVEVEDGLFDVAIPFPVSDFDGAQRYVEITVDSQILAPRTQITSTPYAYKADYIDDLDSTSLSQVGHLHSAGDVAGPINADTLQGHPADEFINTSSTAQTKSGGLIVSADDTAAAVLGLLGYGVQAVGDTSGGYFADANGTSEVWLAEGSDGIRTLGNATFQLATGSIAITTPGGWPGIIAYSPNGHRRDVQFYNDFMSVAMSDSSSPPSITNGIRIYESGRVAVKVLQITGGADISEQFDVGTADELAAGMLVSIDPDHPGNLIISGEAYDSRVAGIISGAGGVKTGMSMGHDGSVADGALPVAMAGRVYALATASNGSIRPGDLLTTSNIPGHAMRATSRKRSRGAILGKALSPLEKDEGLILVLVGLQ